MLAPLCRSSSARDVVDRFLARGCVGRHDEAQLQQITGFAVERKPGAVGSAMLAAVEHVDQGFADFVRTLVFEQYPCDSTHGAFSRKTK